MAKRIVIIGGVAAGASAAAKARRTSEDIEIVLVEAGPYVSFANCGLPYYVGGEIANRSSLFVVTAQTLERRFNITIRTNTRATGIDPAGRTVTLAEADGGEDEVSYDRLVLATGTVGIVPPIEGLRRPNIFTVRTVPDVDRITEFLASVQSGEAGRAASETGQQAPLKALVIGGGYIGLETAEQLHHRGLNVTVVEMKPQFMPGALDAEIAGPLQAAMEGSGCRVILGDGVSKIVDRGGRSIAVTQSGQEIPFEIGILAVGVRPNVELARSAGITLGETGAIQVDRFQRTSLPEIYAAGDNSETRHLVTGAAVNIPLAGPANKAGRVAGANAVLDLEGADEDDPQRLQMPAILGTAVVRVFGQVAGVTGLTETQAARQQIPYEALYIPAASHVGYYPGAEKLLMKLLFDPSSGKVLGTQVVGAEGVDKRIDVIATALVGGLTVEDMENLDLAYAPPFGSAKDAPILAGFAASNIRRGLMPSMTPAELLDELDGENPPVVIDVRTSREYQNGRCDDAINVPVNDLRNRLDEIPGDRPVALYCAGGYRSYVAQRILMNLGRDNVTNILGGLDLIRQVQRSRNA